MLSRCSPSGLLVPSSYRLSAKWKRPVPAEDARTHSRRACPPPAVRARVQVKDAMFDVPDVYDVIVKQQVHRRPGARQTYDEAWRKKYGDGVPVPLASELKELGASAEL